MTSTPEPSADAHETPPAPHPRRRILVSAYTLSPRRGSEPAGAWNVITRLAAYHDVTVITSPNVEGDDYRTETQAYLARNPIPGLSLHCVAPPPLAKKLMKPTGSLARLLYYTGYAAWQRAALAAAKELHAHQPFELIHQLNMTGYREPGYLWQLDAPFVWGPIGGAANVPWNFLTMMSRKEQLFYAIRNVANLVQRKVSIRCKKAAEKARVIWHIGTDEKNLIEQHWHRNVAEPMLDSGTLPTQRMLVPYDGKRPLRIVWSGVHIGRKALPILLHAIATIRHQHNVHLTILGNGPQTEAWDTIAHQLNIADKIRWLGKLSREAAISEMANADVLAFTSLSEGAPYVVLEAISMGLPVICHDVCGMAVAVNETCGIKVPLTDRQSSIRGFAGALSRLCSNPGEVKILADGAAARAHELTWDAKVQQIVHGYERVLAVPPPQPVTPSAPEPLATAAVEAQPPTALANDETAFAAVPPPTRQSLFARPEPAASLSFGNSESPQPLPSIFLHGRSAEDRAS